VAAAPAAVASLTGEHVSADTAQWIGIAAPLVLVAVLILAVGQDMASHRIPNVLTLGALGAGLVLAAAAHGFEGLGRALAGAAIGLACFMPLYLAKGMGAGDVKLMAGAGAFLGPLNAFLAAMLTLAAGAVIGIVVLTWRIVDLRGASSAGSSAKPGALATGSTLTQIGKKRFPYAAAIAVGVMATLWLRGLLKPLAGSLA